MKKPLVRSVPGELLFTGYHWETVRQEYFARLKNYAKVEEIRAIRKLYSDRIFEECKVTVDFQ